MEKIYALIPLINKFIIERGIDTTVADLDNNEIGFSGTDLSLLFDWNNKIEVIDMNETFDDYDVLMTFDSDQVLEAVSWLVTQARLRN